MAILNLIHANFQNNQYNKCHQARKSTIIFRGVQKITWVDKYTQTVIVACEYIHPLEYSRIGLKALISYNKSPFSRLHTIAEQPRLNGRAEKEKTFMC